MPSKKTCSRKFTQMSCCAYLVHSSFMVAKNNWSAKKESQNWWFDKFGNEVLWYRFWWIRGSLTQIHVCQKNGRTEMWSQNWWFDKFGNRRSHAQMNDYKKKRISLVTSAMTVCNRATRASVVACFVTGYVGWRWGNWMVVLFRLVEIITCALVLTMSLMNGDSVAL